MSSNANNEQDKISALNVQIEKAVESNSYVISLFEFACFNTSLCSSTCEEIPAAILLTHESPKTSIFR